MSIKESDSVPGLFYFVDAEMDRGYVKLWRKITDSKCFKNEGLLKVWIWCLTKASYTERLVSVRTGKGITEVKINPGEFIFGRHTSSKELDMNPNTVYKRIQKLKNMGNCNIKSNTHCSIISIVNWPIYQSDNNFGNTQSNTQVTPKYQPSNTNKKVKNENKEKNNTLPEWFPESVWKRFLNHRKAVKAPIQSDSYESFYKKFDKLRAINWEPEKVVDIMVEKGWRWFKPEWLMKGKGSYGLTENDFGNDSDV